MLLSDATVGFLLFMSASGKSPETGKSYQYILSAIERELGNPDVQKIQRYDLIGYLASVDQRCTPATVQTHWKVIRSFFNWAEEEFSMQNRPDYKLPCPAVPEPDIQPFTEDDIRQVVKAAEFKAVAQTQKRAPYRMRRPTANRDKALIYFLLDTGVRISECARLKVEDVDYTGDGSVHIKAYGTGAKSRAREVYLGKKGKNALWRYLVERDDLRPIDPLFVSSHTDLSMDANGFRHVLTRIGKRADVPGVHPHRFRHTFAIQYLRNGGDVYTLQRLLGHNSLDMCKRYLAISQADIQSAHRKASPADNWRI